MIHISCCCRIIFLLAQTGSNEDPTSVALSLSEVMVIISCRCNSYTPLSNQPPCMSSIWSIVVHHLQTQQAIINLLGFSSGSIVFPVISQSNGWTPTDPAGHHQPLRVLQWLYCISCNFPEKLMAV
jgi:hypothetical protein